MHHPMDGPVKGWWGQKSNSKDSFAFPGIALVTFNVVNIDHAEDEKMENVKQTEL